MNYKVYQFTYKNKGLLIIAAANISNAYRLANELTDNEEALSAGDLDCTYNGSTFKESILLLDRYI